MGGMALSPMQRLQRARKGNRPVGPVLPSRFYRWSRTRTHAKIHQHIQRMDARSCGGAYLSVVCVAVARHTASDLWKDTHIVCGSRHIVRRWVD